jgi:hypothetical protein
MDQNTNSGSGMVCKCPHHKVMMIAVLLIGVVALVGNLGWLSPMVVGIVWPILLIIGAGSKLGGCKCCK